MNVYFVILGVLVLTAAVGGLVMLQLRQQVRLQEEVALGILKAKRIISGFDQRFGTDDDIQLVYDRFGNLSDVETSTAPILKSAQQRVEQAFFESPGDDARKQLPDDAAGGELLDGLKDAQGNGLRYDRVTRDRFRITKLTRSPSRT